MFSEVKNNLGFGFMRLPMSGDHVDVEHTKKMVDCFLEKGFNYFDAAHGYLDGKCEELIKECLTSRYNRDEYILADKLSTNFFEVQKDIRPLFEKQLATCGVEYFDFYLMHSQNKGLYEKFKKCKAYETALELKKEGKIKHFGISFHDSADMLEQILTDYPEIEFVQIQFNYIDYESESVQSRKVYEMCRKFKKPIIVMEPVKGGTLANLPEDALAHFSQSGGSPASYAIRFAAGFEGVFMVLSGMSNLDMVVENTSFMRNFTKLSADEMATVHKVSAILQKQDTVPCTACGYCMEKCPQNILIPNLISCLNTKKTFNVWNADFYYSIHSSNGNKASSCIKCGACENVCPQQLKIRNLLEIITKEFEKPQE